MNNFFVIIICLVLAVSCKPNKDCDELNELKEQLLKLKSEKEMLVIENKELLAKQKELLGSSFDQTNNEDFWDFLWSFMTDSAFQASRISFPLEYKTWKELDDEDIYLGGEIVTYKITKDKWEHDSLYINIASERTQVYDNFERKFGPTNERMIHWFGVETGGDVKYFFKAKRGKWYLVRKEQLGD